MSHRLQVLIPTELDAQVQKAAQRHRVSKGEWVRRVLTEAVASSAKGGLGSNPLARLEALDGPTADIERMLTEIESGRS